MIFDTKLDSKGFSASVSALGKVASGGFKIFTAAAGAAASGVAAIGTAAISSYAEYEQLIGGVETLYGTELQSIEEYAASVGKTTSDVSKEYEMMLNRQNDVLNNASNAYKTAGMSANEYMDTVNGFAASLTSSLGEYEWQAAGYADMIVTDMSDNANKMGTSMESIQNAYSGFAKQNYTMLDNLKLGYGGTKTEMERLLRDAEKYAGYIEGSLSIDSFADVAEAIHIVQEEMGIAGTTAKEAATTISGSMNMAKAAWSNLLTGIADDSADFDGLIDAFVDSVIAVAGNLIPRITVVLSGIGKLIEKLLPIALDLAIQILTDTLPELLQSGVNMIQALIRGIQENFPTIMDAAVDIVMLLVDSFIGMLPEILNLGLQIIVELALGIADALPELIPTIVDVLLQIVDVLIENIDLLLDAALQLIIGLTEGLIAALPALIERLPEIVMTIVETLIEYAPELLQAALVIITMLLEGLFQYLPQLLVMLPQLVARITSTLSENAPEFIDSAIEFILSLLDGLWEGLPDLLSEIPGIVEDIIDAFMEIVGDFAEIGDAIIDGIWNGISAGWDWLIGKVKELAGDLFNGAKDELEVNSPSRKFRWLAEMCCAGWDEGAEGLMSTDSMTKNMKANLSTLQMNVTGARTFGRTNAGYGGFQQIVNINQPVRTPDEMARAMRLESKYGLVRGDVVYG